MKDTAFFGSLVLLLGGGAYGLYCSPLGHLYDTANPALQVLTAGGIVLALIILVICTITSAVLSFRKKNR